MKSSNTAFLLVCLLTGCIDEDERAKPTTSVKVMDVENNKIPEKFYTLPAPQNFNQSENIE